MKNRKLAGKVFNGHPTHTPCRPTRDNLTQTSVFHSGSVKLPVLQLRSPDSIFVVLKYLNSTSYFLSSIVFECFLKLLNYIKRWRKIISLVDIQTPSFLSRCISKPLHSWVTRSWNLIVQSFYFSLSFYYNTVHWIYGYNVSDFYLRKQQWLNQFKRK